MHALDNAAKGRFAIRALAREMGDAQDDSPESSEQAIADMIANLMHYAQTLGLDPNEVAEHGMRYFDGDAENEFWPYEGGVIYHGTATELAEGATLSPGPHLHHVFGTTTIKAASSWGGKKADGGPVYVYEVEAVGDALTSETGDILMPKARVVRRTQ